jgi:hypothetical protein
VKRPLPRRRTTSTVLKVRGSSISGELLAPVGFIDFSGSALGGLLSAGDGFNSVPFSDDGEAGDDGQSHKRAHAETGLIS